LRNHDELIAAVPFAWGWGLTWIDIGLAVFFYLLCGLGVTAGFHRYFTHRAFKANRALRIALAVAGSMAFQGSIITWVADHRRHHIFTDKEGDPHSPWLFGTSAAAVARGFWHAHLGWLFDKDKTNALHHVTWSTNSLPHDRKQTVHPARPINQLLGAGHPVHGRVLAQPPPR
jgi:fatty-acid desaturase